MIRIKCPKCAAALKLDDEEAGQVGECDECGAKFRVPAAKAASPSRPRREEVTARRPVSRKRDDEDEEDEDEDEDDVDDEEDATAKKRLSKRQVMERQQLTKEYIQTATSLLLIILILAVGGIFINRLGQMAGLFGVAALSGCGFMLAKLSVSENGMAFFLILLGPIAYIAFLVNAFLQFMMEMQVVLFLLLFIAPAYGLFWGFKNWDRAGKLCIYYVACMLLFFAGAFSSYANLIRVEEKRKLTLEEMNSQPVRPLKD